MRRRASPKVARAADEGRGEGVLVDVVRLIGRSENFALVDVIDSKLLQNLRFSSVTDARLGHDGNGDGLENLFDQGRASHPGHASFGADHGGHTLQSHHRCRTGLFGDARLLDAHHVHDDAALQHLGQADFQAQVRCRKTLVCI